jgi:hypothetical protein
MRALGIITGGLVLGLSTGFAFGVNWVAVEAQPRPAVRMQPAAVIVPMKPATPPAVKPIPAALTVRDSDARPDGPPSNPAAEKRYTALVNNSPWFREIRETVECGTIDDVGVKKTCIDSFGARPKALPAGFVAPPPAPQAKPWTAPKE